MALFASPLSVDAQNTANMSSRAKMLAQTSDASEHADSIVSAFVTIDEEAFDTKALEQMGVKVSMRAGKHLTARIPIGLLPHMPEVKGVEYVQVATQVSQMLDIARLETGGEKVTAGTELSCPYTGKGVVVGIVDAGFDYTHAAFYDSDHNLRIKRVWEQSSTPSNGYTAPDKYGYGIELATPEAIEGAGGDVSGNTHGTHVACIAAGSDDYMEGLYKGMAPDADIVLVSMGESSRDNVNISNALAYIFDYAAEAGKPCVVNLSLGAHSGPHDGTSTFDVIADELQGPGRLIVGSAGNHRTNKFHVCKSFLGTGDGQLKTFIDFKGSAKPDGEVEVWASKDMSFEADLALVKKSTNNVVERVHVYPSVEATAEVSLGSNATGTISVSSETSPLNGKSHVLIATPNLKSVRNNYAIALEITPKGMGQVDVWADNVYAALTSNGIEGYEEPGAASTIAEIGGTGKRILTAGAYTTRKDYVLINETKVNSLDETVGALGSFSSSGPTADGRMKPEVSAPGCFIISAISSNGASGQLLAANSETGGKSNLYGYMQGTSMSSPLVAGVVATWLQAYPGMTPEELHDIVRRTSRVDEFTGDLSLGSNDWGYGKIDAYAGLKECIELGLAGCIDKAAPFNGAVSMYDGSIKVSFPLGASNANIKVYAASGAMMLNEEFNDIHVGNDISVDTQSLPAGVYILKVSAGNNVKMVRFFL